MQTKRRKKTLLGNLVEFRHTRDTRCAVLVQDDSVRRMEEEVVPGCIDVIVTSCPYNLGIKYDEYDDSIPRDEYLKWTSRWLSAAARALKPNGSLFLNMGWKPSDLTVAEEVLAVARQGGWKLQNKIAWAKSVTVPVRTPKDLIKRAAAMCSMTAKETRLLVAAFADIENHGLEQTLGHFKPMDQSKRFLSDCFEVIYHLTSTKDVEIDKLAVGTTFTDKSNISRFGGTGRPDKRDRGNVWWIPYDTIQNRDKDRPHPASFPVEVPTRCIKLHGVKDGMVVMDPFGGIGTTTRACVALGVSSISIEKSKAYHRAACKAVERAI